MTRPSIVLDSVGIGYDIVNGLIWAGHGLVSGIKLVTFSVAETYNNWNQDVFYDASNTLLEEVEEFFDASLASYTEDVTPMGSDFSYNNDNSI
ncbi:hypothetical protein [Candidatus Tisiphia endosymbiont of Ditula angustiorana]|uniref:hypothetical protein n=1 Tax=Candidatus Tisiphia endosymbiont of Ditula angustiorana TaxID=3066272 RepID=UPI00312CB9D1